MARKKTKTKRKSKEPAFSWKQNSGFRVSAKVVGRELIRLEKKHDGLLTPIILVREAKPVTSPLHKCFQWDDKKAAEQHRLSQAREIFRKIAVVYVDPKTNKKEKNRYYESIHLETGRAYTSLPMIVSYREMADDVKDEVLMWLLSFRKKLERFNLKELKAILKAIEDYIDNYS